ncbi:ead/Ea22-like family protein [Citrobacter freundii]|nr:ead/Ea22-like family protein [Citrobacter freundii]EKW0770183.1 ead/Ea22-like family protein [Citrobacter freundii]
MSNIDKQALLEAAATAKIAGEAPVMPFDQRITALNDFMKQCTPATVLELLDELERKEERIAELEALARGVKQFSEFQICHYGATEDYAKGYIDCQNNYNKVLFSEAGKGE